MATGRVEFAPDYKSERRPKYPEMTERFKQLDQRHERLRLEHEIAEAAKRDRLAAQKGDGSNRDIDAAIDTRRALNEAIDRLLEFESLQEKKG